MEIKSHATRHSAGAVEAGLAPYGPGGRKRGQG